MEGYRVKKSVFPVDTWFSSTYLWFLGMRCFGSDFHRWLPEIQMRYNFIMEPQSPPWGLTSKHPNVSFIWCLQTFWKSRQAQMFKEHLSLMLQFIKLWWDYYNPNVPVFTPGKKKVIIISVSVWSDLKHFSSPKYEKEVIFILFVSSWLFLPFFLWDQRRECCILRLSWD